MMKVKILIALFSGLCLLAAPSTAAAKSKKFMIDDESLITFKIEHAVGFNTGFVKKLTGSFTVDYETYQILDVTLEGDLTSLTTLNEDRDIILKSEDFLDAARYPAIKLKLTGKKNKKRADLTVKDTTKPIEVLARLVGFMDMPNGSEVAHINLIGSFNRGAFGMDYNVKDEEGDPLLGERIEFFIKVHGVDK